MRNMDVLRSNGVDVDHGLELLGDTEMYDETIEDFLTESSERVPKIKEYKDTKDLENYAILVHAMKSDSKYLGFTKLADLSYQHEIESKANNQVYVDTHFEELMQEVDRIINLIHKYLGK